MRMRVLHFVVREKLTASGGDEREMETGEGQCLDITGS